MRFVARQVDEYLNKKRVFSGGLWHAIAETRITDTFKPFTSKKSVILRNPFKIQLQEEKIWLLALWIYRRIFPVPYSFFKSLSI